MVAWCMYADNITLYRPIYTPADYNLLQQDSDDICTWTTNNLLNSTPPNASMVITVYIDNLQMEQVYSYRYLGVWLTSTLSWSCKSGKKHGYKLLALCSMAIQTTLSCMCPTSSRASKLHGTRTNRCNLKKYTLRFALKVCTGKWIIDYDSLLNSCKCPLCSVEGTT